jgi:hypothetical protein
MAWVILDHRDDRQVGAAQTEADAMQVARHLLDEKLYAVEVYEVDSTGRYRHVALVTTQDDDTPVLP